MPGEIGTNQKATDDDKNRLRQLGAGRLRVQLSGLVQMVNISRQLVLAARPKAITRLVVLIHHLGFFDALTAQKRLAQEDMQAPFDELPDVGIEKPGALGNQDEIETLMPVGFEGRDIGRDLGASRARPEKLLAFINRPPRRAGKKNCVRTSPAR